MRSAGQNPLQRTTTWIAVAADVMALYVFARAEGAALDRAGLALYYVGFIGSFAFFAATVLGQVVSGCSLDAHPTAASFLLFAVAVAAGLPFGKFLADENLRMPDVQVGDGFVEHASLWIWIGMAVGIVVVLTPIIRLLRPARHT